MKPKLEAMQKLIFLFLLLNLWKSSHSQIAESLVVNTCTSHLTCSSCISSPKCAWCSDELHKQGNPRCDFEFNLKSQSCKDIHNPSSSVHTIKDEALSNVGAISGSAVQLQPQHLHLQLRANEPTTFNLTFRQAEDYPVDLYYLMDLTFSMKEHKEKIAELADTLALNMYNITKNFRLGFGSFIDKVVMPYADMHPTRLKNPCRDIQCSPPYGFRNHMPLDVNVSRFTEEVSRAQLSGNLDNAEGGFDAIMQAIVCKDHIKWNAQSRKILLFATDSIFHYAGDGKLGGIVKPNDGHCHLDNMGYYTESIHQDYPSLSQINQKMTDNKMTLIFAVPEERAELYHILSSHIEGASTGELSEDSSNVVLLISQQYEKIRSEVNLKDDATFPISIQYSTKCLGTNLEKTNVCGGLKIGNTVTFELTVQASECPANPKDRKRTVIVNPVGLGDDLRLDIELMCDCDCEKETELMQNSPKCSGNGTYTCGICDCNTNYFGSNCQCAGDDVIREDMMALCRMDINSTVLCSGKGDCVCGQCECYSTSKQEDRIYGQFCECDTFSCERDKAGEICGGPSRGKCCGLCICIEGWSGEACDCSTKQDSCMAPGDDVLCSGHGTCECGICKCSRTDKDRYGGRFCEDCSVCEGRCTEFYPWVQCQVFGSGPYTKEECANSTFEAIQVDDIPELRNDERKCIFKDDDNCSFIFAYAYDRNNQPMVRVKKSKECPKEAPVVWIVLGVSGGVFLIGLVIIAVFRLCIYLKDKRDYRRFQEEVKNKSQWSPETNPLYKNAISKYQNPLFSPNTST